MGSRRRWYPPGVGDAGNPRFVAAHVRYLESRSGAETDRLAALILRWAWPAGLEDRFEPLAAACLQHWDTEAMGPAAHECCSGERPCASCN